MITCPYSTLRIFFENSCHALQALLPLVVGSANKDLEENSCRILLKFFYTKKTYLNPDVMFNFIFAPKESFKYYKS